MEGRFTKYNLLAVNVHVALIAGNLVYIILNSTNFLNTKIFNSVFCVSRGLQGKLTTKTIEARFVLVVMPVCSAD